MLRKCRKIWKCYKNVDYLVRGCVGAWGCGCVGAWVQRGHIRAKMASLERGECWSAEEGGRVQDSGKNNIGVFSST